MRAAVPALPAALRTRLGSLLEAAATAGGIRADVSAKDLLYAVTNLCLPVADEGVADNRRMVALLIDGLANRADTSRVRA